MAYAYESDTESEGPDYERLLFVHIRNGDLHGIQKLVDEKKVDITGNMFDHDTADLPVPFAIYYVTTRLPSELSYSKQDKVYAIITYLVANGAKIKDPLLDKDGKNIYDIINSHPKAIRAIKKGQREYDVKMDQQKKMLLGPRTRNRTHKRIRKSPRKSVSHKKGSGIYRSSSRRTNTIHRKIHKSNSRKTSRRKRHLKKSTKNKALKRRHS